MKYTPQKVQEWKRVAEMIEDGPALDQIAYIEELEAQVLWQPWNPKSTTIDSSKPIEVCWHYSESDKFHISDGDTISMSDEKIITYWRYVKFPEVNK